MDLVRRTRVLLMERPPGVYRVPGSTSDGYAYAATWNAAGAVGGSLVGNNVAFGASPGDDQFFRVGLRFAPIWVPKAAHVVRARVRLRPENGSAGSPVTIRAQGADNPAVFANFGEVWTRARGAASVAWAMPNWGALISYVDSVDIAPVVQEVFNRAGWVPGNALVLFFDSTAAGANMKSVWAYDRAPAGVLSAELFVQL